METLADHLKALSDPTRLRITRLLCHGELCICDLMAALDMPQSTISRHMSYLKKSGWVRGRRSKKWVYYMLTEPEHPVQAKVLAALRETLPAMQESREDYARLRRHLVTKLAARCG